MGLSASTPSMACVKPSAAKIFNDAAISADATPRPRHSFTVARFSIQASRRPVERVVLRVGVGEAQGHHLPRGLLHGEDGQVRPGPVPPRDALPVHGGDRRRAPVVGEGGVAHETQLFIPVVRPRHQLERVGEVEVGKVLEGPHELLEPAHGLEPHPCVQPVVGLEEVVGVDPYVAGQIVVPAAQALLGAGEAPRHQLPADALPGVGGVHLAVEIGPLLRRLGGRVPDPRPARQLAVDEGGAGVGGHIEVRGLHFLAQLVDQEHSRDPVKPLEAVDERAHVLQLVHAQGAQVDGGHAGSLSSTDRTDQRISQGGLTDSAS